MHYLPIPTAIAYTLASSRPLRPALPSAKSLDKASTDRPLGRLLYGGLGGRSGIADRDKDIGFL
jgi:hypothetical protein